MKKFLSCVLLLAAFLLPAACNKKHQSQQGGGGGGCPGGNCPAPTIQVPVPPSNPNVPPIPVTPAAPLTTVPGGSTGKPNLTEVLPENPTGDDHIVVPAPVK